MAVNKEFRSLHGKIGVLLLNLGTPQDTSVRSVRNYLQQFLGDKRVINLPQPLRWLLVNLVVIPFRIRKTIAAYASIWQDDGSPLLINSRKLQSALQLRLGTRYSVHLGMTYGAPNIIDTLQNMRQDDVTKMIILPLYPQYSSAATGAALEIVLNTLSKAEVIPELAIIKQFYSHKTYINCMAKLLYAYVPRADFILFSYHGLPEAHMVHHQDAPDVCKKCDMHAVCPPITAYNRDCYRAQCYASAQAIAAALDLDATGWGVSFQSRVGRQAWIAPYTEQMIPQLYQRGVRRLVVCCPSFIADCLETLEEIGIRAREQWLALGGISFELVRGLNQDCEWAVELVQAQVNSPTDVVNSLNLEEIYE